MTSRKLFRCGETTVFKITIYCLLKRVWTSVRPVIMPPLTKIQVQKYLKWVEDNMKVDFSKVLFMDESCATLDGHGGWSKGWVISKQDHHQCMRHQQGRCMIWVGIIGSIMVGL